jgi:hypothetical protein
LDLYEWNVLASGAFFESIGALEIALRNAMHEQLAVWCASEPNQWYDDPMKVFNTPTMQSITVARDRVNKKGVGETPGRVVAELSFGLLAVPSYGLVSATAVGSMPASSRSWCEAKQHRDSCRRSARSSEPNSPSRGDLCSRPAEGLRLPDRGRRASSSAARLVDRLSEPCSRRTRASPVRRAHGSDA